MAEKQKIEFSCMCSSYRTITGFTYLHKSSKIHRKFIDYVKSRIPPSDLESLSKAEYIQALLKLVGEYHVDQMLENIAELIKNDNRDEFMMCPCSCNALFARSSYTNHRESKNHKNWLEFLKSARSFNLDSAYVPYFTKLELRDYSMDYLCHYFTKLRRNIMKWNTNQLYSFIKC